jgi:hypothetical protein
MRAGRRYPNPWTPQVLHFQPATTEISFGRVGTDNAFDHVAQRTVET